MTEEFDQLKATNCILINDTINAAGDESVENTNDVLDKEDIISATSAQCVQEDETDAEMKKNLTNVFPDDCSNTEVGDIDELLDLSDVSSPLNHGVKVSDAPAEDILETDEIIPNDQHVNTADQTHTDITTLDNVILSEKKSDFCENENINNYQTEDEIVIPAAATTDADDATEQEIVENPHLSEILPTSKHSEEKAKVDIDSTKITSVEDQVDNVTRDTHEDAVIELNDNNNVDLDIVPVESQRNSGICFLSAAEVHIKIIR